MRNDIACMKAYAVSHQENALTIEKQLRENIDQGTTDTEVKTITMIHFEEWLQDIKDRCAEEWRKKENFFLKLQKEYIEGELSKEPKPQTIEEEIDVTQVLLRLAEDTIVPGSQTAQSTPTARNVNHKKPPTTSTPNPNGQRPQKNQGDRGRQKNKLSSSNPTRQQKRPVNSPRKPDLYDRRNNDDTHFSRSPSPGNYHRQQRSPPRNRYRGDYRPEPNYSPPQYREPNLHYEPQPWRNQLPQPTNYSQDPPMSSNNQQDFFTRLLMKNFLR